MQSRVIRGKEELGHHSAEMSVSAEPMASLFFSPPLKSPVTTFRSLSPLALLPRSARILVLEDTQQLSTPLLLQKRQLKVRERERLGQR